jgi:hypothetical protein
MDGSKAAQRGGRGGETAVARELRFGKHLLFYAPDGPLGGTFTCAVCAAIGRQPELIEHGPGCPYGAAAAAASGG